MFWSRVYSIGMVRVNVTVRVRVSFIFKVLGFYIKDLSYNIYILVVNVRISVFWDLGLGFRVYS